MLIFNKIFTNNFLLLTKLCEKVDTQSYTFTQQSDTTTCQAQTQGYTANFQAQTQSYTADCDGEIVNYESPTTNCEI